MNRLNLTRRDFARLGTGAALAAGAGRLMARPLGLPIGLQLYSVRELLPKDFDGTLAKVRAAGYTDVEAAGYYGRTAAQFRAAMDKAGLKCTSTHHALGDLLDKGDELIEYGHALGLEYLVCSWPSRRDRKDGGLKLDDWRWVAEQFNRMGEKVKAAGMTFGFHNHGPEFGAEGGVVFYDELLRLTDPKLVVFEMDCGWVVSAGRKPEEYILKSPERFALLHIKDLERGADGKLTSAILGRGTMDYRPILRAATSLKHYYIEQEEFDMDPIEALRLNAEYMAKIDL
ncbi:MAG: sugar phosphate isomerase/epimerase [Terracidiphilus sp.]